MSGLRCWPGALAYITHPSDFGHMVEVLYLEPREHYTLPDGFPAFSVGGPNQSMWVIKAMGKPFAATVYRAGGRTPRRAMYAACEDRWLRPITPPPGAEDTPTTADKPQPVEAA